VSLNPTHSSLEEVFIASRGQLVRVARRILRNPELADDAVQDTYLRVAEMRSDTEIARPAAYWTRAVCNMALDYPSACCSSPRPCA
jgi:RNA polymerase sigma-70 factor (ECF subfamily)